LLTLQARYACHTEEPSKLNEPKPTFNLSFTDLDLTNLRIGVPNLPEVNTLDGVRKQAFEEALTVLRDAGAEIVRDVHITGAQEFLDLPTEKKQIVLDTDMKTAMNAYFMSLVTNPQNIHTITSLIKFTKKHPGEEYPQRNVAVLERAKATAPYAALYQEMVEKDRYFASEGGIPGALEREKLNVILMPQLSVTMSTFAAKAGSPALSLPMGVYSSETPVKRGPGNGMIDVGPGIPFSLYMFGGVERDAELLKVAFVFEQLKGKAVRESLKPYLLPKTEISDVTGTTASKKVS
jgi:amidase